VSSPATASTLWAAYTCRSNDSTGLAKLIRDDRARWEVRFVPAWIDDDSAPRILDSADARFTEVAAFLSQSSRQAGLNAEILVQGGELRIIAGA